MNRLRRNLILILFFALLFSSGIGWFVLQRYFPEHYVSHYPLIPLFFFILGRVDIQLMGKVNNRNPQKSVNIYMIMKLAKFVFCFLVLGLYYLIFGKEHFRDFAMFFAIYYFIYLCLETYFFYRTEKYIKNL